jgi:hypothetical protein
MSGITRASVALLLSVCFFGSAWAGQLDPRLAALTIGGHAFVRLTATGAVVARQPINPMLPRVRADGAVQVYIRPTAPGGQLPAVSELVAVGATSIRPSVVLGVVQAWVPVGRLNDLANLPGVGLVTVPTYAVPPRPVGHNASGRVRTAQVAAASVPTGLTIDQAAVQAMQADWLQAVGATGTGVKVGIISDDNSGLAASQAAGYLPATVWADPNFPGIVPTPGDPAEGTAMLEEVHAMAPDASLGFCGPQTTVDFLTCYNDFATWGVNVIADDLGFPVTDYFSIGNTADQSFAYGVASFTQAHPDIAITSAAGNDAYDYYEAPYTPGPGATIGGTTYPSLMDFGAAVGIASNTQLLVQIEPSASITPVLEWNDPVYTSPDNLVLYLVNGSGAVLAQGTTFQAQDGRIGAYLSYTANSSGETDYLEVACQSCSNPITIKLSGRGNGAATFGIYTYGSENAGQKVANGVMATAAAWVATQSPLSINREAYSGTGPFLYGDFGATSTIAKPDLTGIDSVLVSGAGGFGIPQSSGGALFCGTSATGPNVGALIAALMQAEPGMVSSYYYSTLQGTANQTDFTSFASGGGCSVPSSTGYSQDLSGSGLAQGYAALASFYSFPSTSITKPVSVASGQTGTVTVPVNVNITYSASVQGGSNPATASNCQWTANGVVPQTGASVIYFATAVGTFQIVVNCPDSHGIKSPTPPDLTVSAQNIPAPTVAISNASSSGFNLALTGYEPLTVSATSSNTSVLPDNGITIAPSNCGTSTLNCTVSLNPVIHANGTTTVTITATDQWSRSVSTQQSETYTYTPPSSGGGGGGGSFGWLGIFGLLLLSGLTVLTKR